MREVIGDEALVGYEENEVIHHSPRLFAGDKEEANKGPWQGEHRMKAMKAELGIRSIRYGAWEKV